MIGGDAIGFHAIAEYIVSASETITYNPVSRDTGNFTALNFKTRADYVQPDIPSDAILWDNDTPILWDDNDFIEWD